MGFGADCSSLPTPSPKTADTASVIVADPALAAKVHDATTRPTGGRRALSIPLRAEVYGVQPRFGLIPGLFVTKTKQGKIFLAAKDPSDHRFLQYFYRLVPYVTVRADPRPPRAPCLAAQCRRR